MKVCKSGFDHFSALSGTLSPNFIKSPFLGENFPLFFKIVHDVFCYMTLILKVYMYPSDKMLLGKASAENVNESNHFVIHTKFFRFIFC